MVDQAHAETDRRLVELEDQIDKYYEDVSGNLNAKQAQYFHDYYAQLGDMKSRLADGTIEEDEYEDWLRKQASKASTTKSIQKLASEATRADQKAAAMVNGALAAIYFLNLSWAAKQAQAQYESKFNVSSKLVRHDSPKEIAKAYEEAKARRQAAKMEQQAVIDKMKTYDFYCQKIKAACDYGMKHGKGEREIGKMIDQVTKMGASAARRNARTYFTSTENSGRLDYARELVDKGYEVEKEWIATEDKRTRDSHRNQNHETRPIEDVFTNQLMFPGDTESRRPEEFWNCRCRLQINILGVPDGSSE